MMKEQLRACSHESETVNYTGANVTSCSHDDSLSQGNVSLSSIEHGDTGTFSNMWKFLLKL